MNSVQQAKHISVMKNLQPWHLKYDTLSNFASKFFVTLMRGSTHEHSYSHRDNTYFYKQFPEFTEHFDIFKYTYKTLLRIYGRPG